MFMKFINIPAFIISLAIGLLFVYLSEPTTNVVHVYPTPENIDRILYRDNAENCYKYEANEIECTDDAMTIPMQINGTDQK